MDDQPGVGPPVRRVSSDTRCVPSLGMSVGSLCDPKHHGLKPWERVVRGCQGRVKSKFDPRCILSEVEAWSYNLKLSSSLLRELVFEVRVRVCVCEVCVCACW